MKSHYRAIKYSHMPRISQYDFTANSDEEALARLKSEESDNSKTGADWSASEPGIGDELQISMELYRVKEESGYPALQSLAPVAENIILPEDQPMALAAIELVKQFAQDIGILKWNEGDSSDDEELGLLYAFKHHVEKARELCGLPAIEQKEEDDSI